VAIHREPPLETQTQRPKGHDIVGTPLVDDAGLERETVRRVGVRLIPFLLLMFIAAYLDRTNVSLAALQMNKDLGLSASVYGLGSGIFFIGYALFEVPSNLILTRVGARRWMARIAITWGLLAATMIFVRGPRSFYTIRFLLGFAEAGFFPGIIYYLGDWFPERQRARAIAGFMIAVPLSSTIGGPLGGALLSLSGWLGLAGCSGSFWSKPFRRWFLAWRPSFISPTVPRTPAGSRRINEPGSAAAWSASGLRERHRAKEIFSARSRAARCGNSRPSISSAFRPGWARSTSHRS